LHSRLSGLALHVEGHELPEWLAVPAHGLALSLAAVVGKVASYVLASRPLASPFCVSSSASLLAGQQTPVPARLSGPHLSVYQPVPLASARCGGVFSRSWMLPAAAGAGSSNDNTLFFARDDESGGVIKGLSASPGLCSPARGRTSLVCLALTIAAIAATATTAAAAVS
jgi:hypothetical protein